MGYAGKQERGGKGKEKGFPFFEKKINKIQTQV
jgi:hypothetical protein